MVGILILFEDFSCYLKKKPHFVGMNSKSLHHFAKVSALETDRFIPTAEDIAASFEAMALPELVALLGGTVTKDFVPYRKTYSLTYNGVEIALVTYTQEDCFFYTGRMFQNGQWMNVARMGDACCVEVL